MQAGRQGLGNLAPPSCTCAPAQPREKHKAPGSLSGASALNSYGDAPLVNPNMSSRLRRWRPLCRHQDLENQGCRKKCDPEPRVGWGELGATAPPPAAAEISQGLSGEPQNPPESSVGGLSRQSVSALLSNRIHSAGFFSFFRGRGRGRE